MESKPAFSIEEQLELLETRGLLFRDKVQGLYLLKNISYFRLKGYWWDMQLDPKVHQFKPESYFEDVVARYKFDRQLRIILFDAVEYIEIALRTKMINYLSLAYNKLWYLNPDLLA
ncbi:MAG: Abi family protein [Bacteroidetes bacterium]|nr:Abi family protein [Bacteroidota bacterium]